MTVSVPFPMGTVLHSCPVRAAEWLIATGPLRIATETLNQWRALTPPINLDLHRTWVRPVCPFPAGDVLMARKAGQLISRGPRTWLVAFPLAPPRKREPANTEIRLIPRSGNIPERKAARTRDRASAACASTSLNFGGMVSRAFSLMPRCAWRSSRIRTGACRAGFVGN